MKRVLVILLVFACIGCDDVRLPQPLTQLVVEGWVEDGGRPVVMLTTAVPVDTEYKDLTELREHIVRWGKVTISDGEDEAVLSGRVDRKDATMNPKSLSLFMKYLSKKWNFDQHSKTSSFPYMKVVLLLAEFMSI